MSRLCFALLGDAVLFISSLRTTNIHVYINTYIYIEREREGGREGMREGGRQRDRENKSQLTLQRESKCFICYTYIVDDTYIYCI